MSADAPEDISQIGERVNAEPFAARNHAGKHVVAV
jgi:hypothetical protein